MAKNYIQNVEKVRATKKKREGQTYKVDPDKSLDLRIPYETVGTFTKYTPLTLYSRRNE